jgi:hypothetical protein
VFPNLGGEHRTEPVLPKPHSLLADLDTALVQQVLDIPERERKANLHHHRQVDDFVARLEPLEGTGLSHATTLASPLPSLKPSSSDNTSPRGRDRNPDPTWDVAFLVIAKTLENNRMNPGLRSG